MPPITRTVRFRDEEARQIEQFLRKNPFLDFSTLARLAIAQFIEQPRLKVTPVTPRKNKSKSEEKTHG